MSLNSLGKLEGIRQVLTPAQGEGGWEQTDFYQTRFRSLPEWREALHTYADAMRPVQTPRAMPRFDPDTASVIFRAPDSTVVEAHWDADYSVPILRVHRAKKGLPHQAILQDLLEDRLTASPTASLYWDENTLDWLHAKKPDGLEIVRVHGLAALYQAKGEDQLVDTLVTPGGWFQETQRDIIQPHWMDTSGAPQEAIALVRDLLIPSLFYAEPAPRLHSSKPPKHSKHSKHPKHHV